MLARRAACLAPPSSRQGALLLLSRPKRQTAAAAGASSSSSQSTRRRRRGRACPPPAASVPLGIDRPSEQQQQQQHQQSQQQRRRVIAVAVDQSHASRRAVAWAVEHLWREEGDAELVLLHVVPAVSSTSAFALGGLAAGVASAPVDSAASLDGDESGGDGGESGGEGRPTAAELAAAEAIAAAGLAPDSPAEPAVLHHSSDEQRALARRAGRALSASLLPVARRRGCSRATVAVIRGKPGLSVAEDVCRAALSARAAMLVVASSRRPGGGGGGSDEGGDAGGGAGGGWLGHLVGSVLRPPVSAEIVRRCKVPTVLLGPE